MSSFYYDVCDAHMMSLIIYLKICGAMGGGGPDICLDRTWKIWDPFFASVFCPVKELELEPGVADKGIRYMSNLFEGRSLLSFEQIQVKSGLSSSHFFRDLQLRLNIQENHLDVCSLHH